MSDTSNSSSPVQLGGKKSNGHKMNCGCPICKNMKKSMMGGVHIKPHVASHVYNKMKGGKRKSNGHKMNCGCPICKNMKKGGDMSESEGMSESSMSSSMDTDSSSVSMGEHRGGGKTKRKSSRKSRKSSRKSHKSSRKSRKSRK